MSAFRKASRKQAKLRLALCGPAGSGKTIGALHLAQGLKGRVAMIDTERGSGELYAHKCDYDVAQLTPPFSPKRYIELIHAATSEYDVLIIDSLSHAWAGEGGVLDMHDAATKAERGGNSYTAWRNVTPQHNALVDAILQAPCHIIVTMRTKTAYEITEDDRGKKKPVKIGLAPVQRDGLDYEFSVVMDLSPEHVFTASKDRTGLFDGRHEMLARDHGEELRDWLMKGETPEDEARRLLEEPAQQGVLALQSAWGKLPKDVRARLEALKDSVYKPMALAVTPAPDRVEG